jgi:hypothetical protein
METRQLNNYNIEFYSEKDWDTGTPSIKEIVNKKAIFYGLCDKISKELAEKIVDKMNNIHTICKDWIFAKDEIYKIDETGVCQYIDYKQSNLDKSMYICKTAKQSFATLSDLPYCVITKLN